MDEKVEKTKMPSRLLGDEWEEWTGDLDESISYEETARLFAIYAVLALLFILAGLAVTLYMIEPRLLLINPVIFYTVRALAIAIILGTAVWGLLIALSVFTGKNF